jgi:stage V sporulation protein B
LTAIAVASPLLSVLSISIFFLASISVTNAILQAFGYESKTIISTVVGIVAKVILSYVLIGHDKTSMFGAPISTLACYFIIMCLNFYFVVKYTGYLPSIRKIFFKPIIASIVSVGVGAIVHTYYLSNYLGNKSVILSILLSSFLYFTIPTVLKNDTVKNFFFKKQIFLFRT